MQPIVLSYRLFVALRKSVSNFELPPGPLQGSHSAAGTASPDGERKNGFYEVYLLGGKRDFTYLVPVVLDDLLFTGC